MSTNKGCAPGKSSLIGLGSARDYDGCAILELAFYKNLRNLINLLFDSSLGVLKFSQHTKMHFLVFDDEIVELDKQFLTPNMFQVPLTLFHDSMQSGNLFLVATHKCIQIQVRFLLNLLFTYMKRLRGCPIEKSTFKINTQKFFSGF